MASEDTSTVPPFARKESDFSLACSSSTQIAVRRDGMSDLRLICTDDTPSQYHVRNSLLRPGIPPVTLFSGIDNKAQKGRDGDGAIVGVCHFPAFSHRIAVGRGNPLQNPGDIEWESLDKTSRDHSTYEFAIPVEGGVPGERQSYRWKRTHAAGVREGTSTTKWNMRSWKLEECSTQQIVAVYAANTIKYGKEAGRIKFVADRSEEWKQWVLLTYLGLSEKARRRAMARRDISWFF